jgi:uncharacterized protein YoxC
MDILFYISGLITTLLVVLVVAVIHAYAKFKTLIEYSEFVSTESSQVYKEIETWKDNLDSLVRTIQNDMKNDGYESTSKLNDKISGLQNEINTVNQNFASINSAMENNFTKINHEFSTIMSSKIANDAPIDRY